MSKQSSWQKKWCFFRFEKAICGYSLKVNCYFRLSMQYEFWSKRDRMKTNQKNNFIGLRNLHEKSNFADIKDFSANALIWITHIEWYEECININNIKRMYTCTVIKTDSSCHTQQQQRSSGRYWKGKNTKEKTYLWSANREKEKFPAIKTKMTNFRKNLFCSEKKIANNTKKKQLFVAKCF